MSLAVKQDENAWPKEEYDVMHAELRVGRIWKTACGCSDMRWFWTLGGVFNGPEAKLRHSGLAGTLADAKAELTTEWAKWLAWAELTEARERNGRNAIQPRLAQAAD
jgi:hypothetical protein